MSKLVQLIEEMLRAARAAVLDSVRDGWGLRAKGLGAFGDVSYGFDLAAERAVINLIEKRLKDAAIISEELGVLGPSRPDYYVVIDPVDGSKNASRGIPFYSTSIIVAKGLKSSDIVAAGVIDHATGDIYVGERDGDVLVAGGSPRLSQVESLEEAFIFLDHGSFKHSGGWAERIVKKARATRFMGSAALEISYILSGKVDGFACLSRGLRPLDFMAPLFLLKLVGGSYRVLGAEGEVDLGAGRGFGVLAASNHRLLEEILGLEHG